MKTSENPEEAIDVSSENLKLLKEESQMVDTETLMRYIRVFSDLSSQIRYATQKRVLMEIGLIKLCRPAMETNLDSVLDRLRVLEQRIDEGAIVQQTVVQSGGVVQQTGAQPAQEEKKPAKAAPEDLQKIVAGWRAIAGADYRSVQRSAFKGSSQVQMAIQANLYYMWSFRTFLARIMWMIRKPGRN